MTERWNRHSVIRPPKINSSCPLPANLAKTPARTDPAKTTAPVRRKVATTALPKVDAAKPWTRSARAGRSGRESRPRSRLASPSLSASPSSSPSCCSTASCDLINR
ncbi:uncharacterized protein [Choristoneura fumiferana]|uniref:uncharacterized protein n=1 Tax=Choristoneura fumiferana TaxID=7141 RepID=UPI003D159C97